MTCHYIYSATAHLYVISHFHLLFRYRHFYCWRFVFHISFTCICSCCTVQYLHQLARLILFPCFSPSKEKRKRPNEPTKQKPSDTSTSNQTNKNTTTTIFKTNRTCAPFFPPIQMRKERRERKYVRIIATHRGKKNLSNPECEMLEERKI